MKPFMPGRRLLLGLSALLAAERAAAAGPRDDRDPGVEPGAAAARIDALLRAAIRADGPGAAVAVVQNGSTLFQAGYGLASVELGVPIGPATVFHVASVSKQFTAMAIALLIEEGKVALNDDVHRFIPELPGYGVKIEVEHLLRHTSGIRDQWSVMALAGWMEGDLFVQDDVLRVICRQQELNFKPGERFDYSNSGYTLLAAIIERVSGMTLRQFSQARLFAPLGMTQTYWRDDLHEVVPGRASSYAIEGGRPRFLPLNLGTVGATGLNTTVADLVKWDSAFYGGALFTPAVLRMATTPRPLSDGSPNTYLFGLIAGEYRGLRTIGHTGADAGFRSNIMRFPAQRCTVILLINNSTLDIVGLSRAIADIVLEGRFKLPAPSHAAAPTAEPAAISLPPGAERRFLGTYSAATGTYIVMPDDAGLQLATDGGATPLTPIGADSFHAAQVQGALLFSGDDGKGRATELSIGTGPKTVVARREADIDYTAAQLEGLAGAYRSPEVDTVLRFTPNGGTLAMTGLKLHAKALGVLRRDRFVGPGGIAIQFQREPGGTATSLRIAMTHIDGMRFDRMT